MGRIKSKMIKNTAKELLKHEHAFTSEFENDKRLLESTKISPSKKIRNKIAGYIARLVKAEKEVKKQPKAEIKEDYQDE